MKKQNLKLCTGEIVNPPKGATLSRKPVQGFYNLGVKK